MKLPANKNLPKDKLAVIEIYREFNAALDYPTLLSAHEVTPGSSLQVYSVVQRSCSEKGPFQNSLQPGDQQFKHGFYAGRNDMLETREHMFIYSQVHEIRNTTATVRLLYL